MTSIGRARGGHGVSLDVLAIKMEIGLGSTVDWIRSLEISVSVL